MFIDGLLKVVLVSVVPNAAPAGDAAVGIGDDAVLPQVGVAFEPVPAHPVAFKGVYLICAAALVATAMQRNRYDTLEKWKRDISPPCGHVQRCRSACLGQCLTAANRTFSPCASSGTMICNCTKRTTWAANRSTK